MKKLVFLALIGFFSCFGDKEYCFACDTQVVIIPKQGALTATNKKVKYCGKTEQEAKEMEKIGTYRTIGNDGSDVQTTTTCVKL